MAAQHHQSHAWTHEQRVCVHILYEEHSLSQDERATVFNRIFKDQLAGGGSDDCRTSKSLSIERSRRLDQKTHSHKAWQAVRRRRYDTLESSAVDRIRSRVLDLVQPSYELVEPSRFTSSNAPTSSTALICNIEKFATFTDSITRKRDNTALCTPPSTADGHGDGFEEIPRAKRHCHSSRHQSPTVVIPRVAEMQALQDVVYVGESPTTEPQNHDDVRAPMTYNRMGNMPLMLSTARCSNAPLTGAPYTDVSEEDAHPRLPALLWRYSDSSSQGENSSQGFKSDRSAHARAPPRGPPLCKDLEWTDVLEHLNPNKRLDHPIHSPFISTSSRLLWLLRKALRKRDPSGCISVVDSSVLNPCAVYYVSPFHTELKRHSAFDDGAQYYKGISEHLVWHEITSSAMIRTVILDDFCAFVNGNWAVKRLMRLDTLASKRKLDEISRIFKRDPVKITNDIAVAIAELVLFFGLGHASRRENLARLVYEIAQGWSLKPDDVSQSSWQAKARWFTHTICRKSDEPVAFAEQSKVYHAFLDGLRSSRGDVNYQFKGHKASIMMQKRALKVGLDHPSHLVIRELESAITTAQLSVASSQGNELEDVDRTPSLTLSTQTQSGRDNATALAYRESPSTRLSCRRLISEAGASQTAIHDGDGVLVIAIEESHDSSDSQPEDSGDYGDQDGSEIVLAERSVQSPHPTSASSWSADETMYE